MLNRVGDVRIIRSKFLSNRSSTVECDIEFAGFNIINEYLNLPKSHIGAVYAAFSNLQIEDTIFDGNIAKQIGAGMTIVTCNLSIIMSQFYSNENDMESYNSYSKGVIFSHGSSVFIDHSKFVSNSASYGGVFYAQNCSIEIANTNFTNNQADYAGVIYVSNSSCVINNSTFISTRGNYVGGVVFTELKGGSTAKFNITNSNFSGNSARFSAGALFAVSGTFVINYSNFVNNSVISEGLGTGGVFSCSLGCTLKVSKSTFSGNSADLIGGALLVVKSVLSVEDSTFSTNRADQYGGTILIIDSSSNFVSSNFSDNMGSFYVYYSNVTFSGKTNFDDNTESTSNKTGVFARHEGGAITSFQSNIYFNGETSLWNNQVRDGVQYMLPKVK